MSALDLVYVDDQIIVLNKASGLLSVPGRGEDKQDCLITRAQQEWPDALPCTALTWPRRVSL